MSLLKYQMQCDPCEQQYYVLSDPEHGAEPSYCPFCGSIGAFEVDNNHTNEGEEE